MVMIAINNGFGINISKHIHLIWKKTPYSNADFREVHQNV